MLASPVAHLATARRGQSSSASGGSSHGSSSGQEDDDDEVDDLEQGPAGANDSSDLPDLSLSNMNFHFSYPSPVKPTTTTTGRPAPSPPPAASPSTTDGGGDDDSQATGSSRGLRRTAKGLEGAVTGFSPGPQERRERSARLLASRSAGPDRDGRLDAARPRAIDRYQTKSQSDLAPSHASPSYSSSSDASGTSPPRSMLGESTTMTNATATVRAALPPTTTPGATTSRHRTSASASSALTAGALGGSVSVKQSRLLGGAVRVTPEERRRRVEQLEREEREREAREADRLARGSLREEAEEDEAAPGGEDRSPESVSSIQSSAGTSRAGRDDAGSQRSSPAATSVSSSYADSPRLLGGTPPPLGAHGQGHMLSAAATSSSTRRGPSPVARDYAASSPSSERPSRPAYYSTLSSDGRERDRDAPYVSPPPPPPPATAPPHPSHAHILSHPQPAPHPTGPPPPPPLPQNQQQQYTPYAHKSHLHAQQQQSQQPQQYQQPPLETYAATPTAHAYGQQQQQQQQHHPSHQQQQQQQLYESTAHQRHYAPMPPPLPVNGAGGMGAHVDQVVAVPLSGAGATKKEKSIEVNGRSYQKLCQIGRGGSSRVFKCLSGRDLVAIKKVSLDRLDSEAIRNYLNEIELLKSLRGDEKVIRLDDEETTRGTSGRPKAIFVVMEFGEADFSKLLEEQKGKRLNMNFVGYFWLQMLECVKVVHDREIIHTDLKPANFVLVRGALKIIDFGISHKIEGDTVHVRRDNQIGTLNYMSPESVQRSNGEPHIVLGKPTDVWALGCILYQMVYNLLPFSTFTNHPSKVSAIISPKYQIPYSSTSIPVLVNLPPDEADRRREEMRSPVDPVAIEVMRWCHGRSEKDRPNIEQLMDHDFLKPWKRTGSSATPKIKTLPPDTTSVSREVLAQLVSYVRENANFSADDAFEKLEEVHRRWAQGS